MTRLHGTALYGVAAVITVLATALLASGAEQAGRIAMIAAPPALALAIRRRYLAGGVSPLLAVACALVGTAGFGAAFGRSVGAHGGVSAQLALSDEETWRTVALLCWSATATLLGGAVVLASARRRRRPAGRALTRVLDEGLAAARRVHRVRAAAAARVTEPGTRALLLAVSALPLVGLVAVDGADLLVRGTYLVGASGSIDGAIAKVGLVGVVGCGLVLGLEEGMRRVPALIVALSYAAVFLALASRSLAMVPVLLAIGVHVARPRRASAVALGVSLVLAVLLLPVPLHLRGIGAHGLVPYLAALPDVLAGTDLLAGAADNLLLTFPLVGTTAFGVAHLPTSLFWLQVNPLPGSAIGWYGVADALRINRDTPFSGAGELGNYGAGVLTGFWLAVGMFLGALEREIAACLELGRRGTALVLTALPLVFVVLILQYNLRSAVRLLVYTAAVALAVRAVRALRDHGARLARPTSTR